MADIPQSGQVNVVDPDTEALGSISQDQLPQALQQGYRQATPDEVDTHFKQEQFGTLPQKVLTGLEGAASVGTLGFSTGVEEALGVNPENILARQDINPGSHGIGQAVGLGLTAWIPGLGEAAVGGLGLEGAGLAARIGAGAVQGTTEMALLESGNQISHYLANDPHQSAETALGSIGLSGLMGAVGGGALGVISPLWKASSEGPTARMLDGVKGALGPEAEAAATAAPQGLLEGLKELKPNAGEIQAAANEIGAPVLESQISASKHIQDLDSMLMQSPTPVGVARQQLAQSGMDAAQRSVDQALGAGTELSNVDVGNAIKKSLTQKLEAEAEPISQLYNTIKQSTDHIPVSENAKTQIAANIKRLEDYKFTGSAMRKLGDNALENLPNINTVDDIKRFKTALNSSVGPTAAPAEKFAVGQIAEKLTNLEEATVVRAAQSMAEQTADPQVKGAILDLLNQRAEANLRYKSLMTKMGDLGDMLGKRRVRGTGDFLNFVEDLTPEEMTRKLFAKNNSEGMANFAKDFPEEFELLKQSRKTALRESSLVDGKVNAGKVLREIDKLSPEVQKMLFSKEELGKINASKTYLDSLPKNINPSMTSKSEAYRRFFTNPASATLESAKDFGIKTILSSVVPKDALEKAIGKDAVEPFFKSIFPGIGGQVLKKETNPSAFKAAVDYGMAVVKGEKAIKSAAKNLFKAGAEVTGSKASEKIMNEKLKKKIAHVGENPQAMLDIGGEIGHYLPDHATALSQVALRSMQYLSHVEPKPYRLSPLDEEIEPTREQEALYDRQLTIANNPLSVLQHIKDGTIIPEDVSSLNAMYPGMYAKISQSLTHAMIDHISDGSVVPYKLRAGLSLFMGQALDSTLTPSGIQAAQAVFQAQRMQAQGGMPMGAPKKSTEKLGKLADSYRTTEQSAIQRQDRSKV